MDGQTVLPTGPYFTKTQWANKRRGGRNKLVRANIPKAMHPPSPRLVANRGTPHILHKIITNFSLNLVLIIYN